MMLVAAHRGSSGTAPENTMAAFREAIEAGADLIELDVRFTLDLELVVMHDRLLGRTTSGRGAVRRCTYAELQELDAGRWFAPRFAGEQVLSLRTVLNTLPAGMGINIEVKTDGDRRSKTVLVRHLHEVIRLHGRQRYLLISSFDHRFLRILRRHDANIPIGILLHLMRDVARRPSVLARRMRAAYVLCSRSFLRRAIVKQAHIHGIKVGVYTVNRTEELARLQRFGIDLVFTNFPSAIGRALRNA